MAPVVDISSSSFGEDQTKTDILNTIHDEIVAIRNSIGNILVGSAVWDVGNLVDAAGESKDVAVTGAALGDFALCSIGVDIVDMTISAQVTAADVVTVRIQNESGGAVDLASTTVRVLVIPKAAVALVAKVLTK